MIYHELHVDVVCLVLFSALFGDLKLMGGREDSQDSKDRQIRIYGKSQKNAFLRLSPHLRYNGALLYYSTAPL